LGTPVSLAAPKNKTGPPGGGAFKGQARR
jgi:hypothetical protein